VRFLDRILGRSRDAEPEKEAHLPVGDVDLREPDPEEAPRGGMQTPEYRTADPRDVVEAEGTLMAGPGGAPQDDGPSSHPDAAGLEQPEEQEEPDQ
jgi:hypothetical protein